MATSHSPRGCSWLAREVARGAFLGDFAREKALPGALTQIVLGYVPVVNTLGALRDVVADWRQGDPIGVALNLVAAFPVLGGVPKTVEVLRALREVRRVMAQQEPANAPTAAPPRR